MIQSLYTGLSALKAFQTGLDVTANNIANVNTPGFSSQRTMFEDTNPGVKVSAIERAEDPILFQRFLNHLKTKTDTDTLNTSLTNLDSKINNSSLTDLLNSFYNEIQSLKNDSSLDKTAAKNIGNSVLDRIDNLNNIFSSEIDDNNKKIKIQDTQLQEKQLELESLYKEIPSNEIKDRIDTLKKDLVLLNTDSLKNVNSTIKKLQDKFNESIAPISENINNFLKTGDVNNVSTDLYNKNYQIDFKTTIPPTGTTDAIFNSTNEEYLHLTSVNLDEEMVNMIKYQRSYEAAAKVIKTSDEMLKTTLDLKS